MEKRLHYTITFPDKSVYYGTTKYTFEKRLKEHKRSDQNKRFKEKFNLFPEFHVELTNYMPAKEASNLEKLNIKIGRELGLDVLNIHSGGGTGGGPESFLWTKEACKSKAKEFDNRTKFAKEAPGAYDACQRNGWLDEVCSHMDRIIKPDGFWNIKENCIEAVSKCSTLNELTKKFPIAYDMMREKGWESFYSHLYEKAPFKLTKEECFLIAKGFKTKPEFLKKDSRTFGYMQRRGWLTEGCSHMPFTKRGNNYYTKEICWDLAKKCKNKVEFEKRFPGAISAAYKNGWIDDICGHMNSPMVPSGFYNDISNLEKVASKYSSRADFNINDPGAYKAAKRLGYFDEICKKMKWPRRKGSPKASLVKN